MIRSSHVGNRANPKVTTTMIIIQTSSLLWAFFQTLLLLSFWVCYNNNNPKTLELAYRKKKMLCEYFVNVCWLMKIKEK